MFKNFPGYKLLEKIQKNKSHKRERKLPLNAIKFLFIVALSLVVVFLPTETFGIEGLTAVHQRIIGLFIFAALMWLTETMPSWVTSMIVVTVMLLTVSTSAFEPFRGVSTTKLEAANASYEKAYAAKEVAADSLAFHLINDGVVCSGHASDYYVACDNFNMFAANKARVDTIPNFNPVDKEKIDSAYTVARDIKIAECDKLIAMAATDTLHKKYREEYVASVDKLNTVITYQETLSNNAELNEKKYTPYVPFKDILGCFANPTIMLFIGGFVLAIGLTKVKLDVALARVLLKPFGTRSEIVLLGFILVTAIFSAFVSNTATAAMMLAFLTPVLRSLPADGKGRIALALAIPVGANLGGMMTPIGTPPNMIALDYLQTMDGGIHAISFVEWTLKMAPFVIILLVLSWLLLRFMFPFKQKNIKIEIEGEIKWNYQTWSVVAAFVVTIFMWMFGTDLWGLDTNVVAMIPIAIFCATGILTRRDLEEINWSVLWMVAGGFALGVALNYKVTDPVTGDIIYNSLSSVIVGSVPFDSFSPLVVMILAGLICFGFSNFISHSAATSLLVPVLGVVAGGLGADLAEYGGAQAMLVGIAIASSVSMILPISTPPNAIAHSTGFIQQKDMMKVGIIIGVLGLALGYAMLIFIGF